MTVFLPEYFIALALDEHATEADVKRAYAVRLKRIDRAADPEGFQQLRAHYEAAIAHLREGRAFMRFEVALEDAREEASPDTDEEATEVTFPVTTVDASQGPAPAPAPTFTFELPHQAADRCFDEMLAALRGLSQQDVDGMRRLFSEAFAKPALEGLAAREAFQRRISAALWRREAGRHSGALFFAALSAFRWSESQPLTDDDTPDWALQRWIDAALLLNDVDWDRWLWLTEEPTHSLVTYHSLDRQFDWRSPLGDLFCSPGERERWQQMANGTPLKPHVPLGDPPAPRRTTWREWRRWVRTPEFFTLVLPLIVVALIALPILIRGGAPSPNDRASKAPDCAQRFETAMAAQWRGLSVADVEQLDACVVQAAPPRCEDRMRYKRLSAIAAVISHSSDGAQAETGYLSGKEYIRLDSKEGPLVQVQGGDCDDNFRQVLTTGGWLRLGDLPTAQSLVHRAGMCAARASRRLPASSIDPPGSASLDWIQDTWSYKLLSRTDAWREGVAEVNNQDWTQLTVRAAQLDAAQAGARVARPAESLSPSERAARAKSAADAVADAAQEKAREKAAALPLASLITQDSSLIGFPPAAWERRVPECVPNR